jgi:hypothetical protein
MTLNVYHQVSIKVTIKNFSESLLFTRILYGNINEVFCPIRILYVNSKNQDEIYNERKFEIINKKIITEPQFAVYNWIKESQKNKKIDDLPLSSAILSVNDEINQFYIKDDSMCSSYYSSIIAIIKDI